MLRELRNVPRGRLLEVGCGAGDLLLHLIALGFSGCCVETSAAARTEARRRLEGSGIEATVVGRLEQLEGSFDLVVACEVLEHIEDDLAALRAWAERLRAGGLVLLTVPAHPASFGPSDAWAGHHRRYSRQELEDLARQSGLVVRRLYSTGFPLSNLIEPIRMRVHRRRMACEGALTPANRTSRSGIERHLEARLSFLSRDWLIRPFCWLQILFLSTDLGRGYLLVAERRTA